MDELLKGEMKTSVQHKYKIDPSVIQDFQNEFILAFNAVKTFLVSVYGSLEAVNYKDLKSKISQYRKLMDPDCPAGCSVGCEGVYWNCYQGCYGSPGCASQCGIASVVYKSVVVE